jgi:hypothetical protein
MRTPTNAVLCALAVVLVTGCTSGFTGSLHTPTPRAPATTTVSPGTASLNCRLPVISPYTPGVPPGGWITFPGGQFARDPASLANRLNARPLDAPAGFPVVNEGYLQNPGVWLSLRGGGLALYTTSDGVRMMTRQTDIFDVAGACS